MALLAPSHANYHSHVVDTTQKVVSDASSAYVALLSTLSPNPTAKDAGSYLDGASQTSGAALRAYRVDALAAPGSHVVCAEAIAAHMNSLMAATTAAVRHAAHLDAARVSLLPDTASAAASRLRTSAATLLVSENDSVPDNTPTLSCSTDVSGPNDLATTSDASPRGTDAHNSSVSPPLLASLGAAWPSADTASGAIAPCQYVVPAVDGTSPYSQDALPTPRSSAEVEEADEGPYAGCIVVASAPAAVHATAAAADWHRVPFATPMTPPSTTAAMLQALEMDIAALAELC
eukprot:TRINITY_DN33446_c0_g1_i1.p1 TRINITY_DN33446_c0_g1~~TRINITY_DN33446_c0_g1_i1.p1  ORF type:complete len:290 (-),score=32.37 TRINITY_DN33446_c0_g1_i1:899-1768(-)